MTITYNPAFAVIHVTDSDTNHRNGGRDLTGIYSADRAQAEAYVSVLNDNSEEGHYELQWRLWN